MQHARLIHATQERPIRALKAQGANGVLPVASDHSTLCQTVAAIKASSLSTLPVGQVIQVGHWTACPWVYSEALSFGNPRHRGHLEGAYAILTELEPGSAASLLETSPFGPATFSNEYQMERSDLVWHSVRPVSPEWTPGLPKGSIALNNHTFAWPVSTCFFRQRQISGHSGLIVPGRGSGAIAWHLLLVRPLVPEVKASVYFKHRDTTYWNDGFVDHHCPVFKYERELGPQDICQECTYALDAVWEPKQPEAAQQAPLQQAPLQQASLQQAPAPSQPIQAPLQQALLQSKLSLDEFFTS